MGASSLTFGRQGGSPAGGYIRSTASGYVGRVGALAVALGIGSAIATVPIAAADTSGSGGASASTSRDAADARTAGGHRRGPHSSDKAVRAGSRPNAAASQPISPSAHPSNTDTRALRVGVPTDVPVTSSPGIGTSVVPSAQVPVPVASRESLRAVSPPSAAVTESLPLGGVSSLGTNVMAWLGSGGSDRPVADTTSGASAA